MKKKITVFGLMVILVAATTAQGSAFRIPEQSLNGVALGNAYGASPRSADASYYNPAAMSWLPAGLQGEMNFTWVHLPSVNYTDNTSAVNSGGSKSEDFLLPNLHIVSPASGDFRFGFSVIYPWGLSKRWDASFPRQTVEDFTLKTYEFNPSVSYRISDKLAFGAGVRVIYAEGEVRSHRVIAPASPFYIRRDLEGDATEYGYNFALSYRPTEALSLAATYRSRIDLDLEGDASLYMNIPLAPPAGTGGVAITYNGYAEVSVVTPEVFTLSAALTRGDTTLEFTWDRTFWSDYQQLDFNYDASLNPALAAFDTPLVKNWDDSDAFRIGVTHRLNDAWTVMAGFALDETPVPAETLGFELPDSDARIYSIGCVYQAGDRLKVGVSYLFDDKESRTVVNSSGINGTFDNGGARLLSFNLRYRF